MTKGKPTDNPVNVVVDTDNPGNVVVDLTNSVLKDVEGILARFVGPLGSQIGVAEVTGLLAVKAQLAQAAGLLAVADAIRESNRG
jgi:ubiquinone biosynthesis protein UbiJ